MRRAPSSFCSSSRAASSGSRRGVDVVVLAGLGQHAFLFGPLIRFRVGDRLRRRRRWRDHPAGTLDRGRRRGRCFRRCRRGRTAGFATHPPVHAQGILERLGDDVGVALFAQPLGQRRRFVTQHQGVALDRADRGTGQHHLGGPAALAHLVAHGRPQGADRGGVRFGRAHRGGSLLDGGLLRRGSAGGRRQGSGSAPVSARPRQPAAAGGGRWLGGRCRRSHVRGLRRRLLSGRNRHVQPRLDPLDPLQQSRFGVAGRRQQQPRADRPRAAGAVPSRRASPSARRARPRRSGSASRDPAGPPARASGPARLRAHRPRRGSSASGTACSTSKSRNRSSRSVANRRGSWPASITDSTAPNSAAASPAPSASTASSISATSVAPSSPSARW